MTDEMLRDRIGMLVRLYQGRAQVMKSMKRNAKYDTLTEVIGDLEQLLAESAETEPTLGLVPDQEKGT